MRLIMLALMVLAFPSVAQEELSAKVWLEKMSHALKEKEFKASIIHVQADLIRPLVYLHGKVDGEEVAFLEYLNGPPKNAVRVGKTVTFIEHDQPAYSVTANRIQGVWPAAFAADIGLLEKGYQFVLGGRSRIAGRPGQMVRIIPNNDDRYATQVWVDMQTYLPLRYDILNKDRELLEQTMVVELLELNEAPHILVEAKKQVWPAVVEQAERTDGHSWEFSWLPQGFTVAVRDSHRLIGSHEPVEYLALTDGLANISVYVSKPGSQALPDELMTRNGLSMVVEPIGKQEIIALGKVPHETLKKIAKSLVLK